MTLLLSLHLLALASAAPSEVEIAHRHFEESFRVPEAAQELELLKARDVLMPALQRSPGDPDLNAKLAQVLGRLALFKGNREKVRLGNEIKEHADRALAADPDQPIAHAVLGVWHYELVRLSFFERVFAKLLFGDVPEGDLASSVHHLETAVRIRPNEIFFRLALAKTLIEMDRQGKAKEQLEKAIALPEASAADPALKIEARQLLGEL